MINTIIYITFTFPAKVTEGLRGWHVLTVPDTNSTNIMCFFSRIVQVWCEMITVWYPQNPIYSQRQSPGFAQHWLKWVFLQISSLILLYTDSTLHYSSLKVYTTVGANQLNNWRDCGKMPKSLLGIFLHTPQTINMNKLTTGRWNSSCFLQISVRIRSTKK